MNRILDKSLSQERLQLARELLDDVELSRLQADQLLLKARRLSRLVEADETATWIEFELSGYKNTKSGRKFMARFGRFTDAEAQKGYWMSLAAVQTMITSLQAKVNSLKIPNVHFAPSSANPNEYIGFTGGHIARPGEDVILQLNASVNQIATLSEIRSRVLAAIHDFALDEYNRLAFSGLPESIFEAYKNSIDELLLSAAGDAVEKIPTVYDRLAEGDTESISQAMNTCRRIIKSFADAVQSPSDDPVKHEGTTYEMGSDKILNRIKVFTLLNCASKTRKERLSKTLRAIYERASVGTHADVTVDEARALFLLTYITLGEILSACDGVEDSDLELVDTETDKE